MESICSSASRSECAFFLDDVEMSLHQPLAMKPESRHATAPKEGSGGEGGNYAIRSQDSPKRMLCSASAGCSTQHKYSRSSGCHRSTGNQQESKTAATKKPIYMSIPFVPAVADWLDQMWYAESIFVRCGEGSPAGTVTKRSGRTRVVVDHSSAATQGSFWSVGAGSENAEVSEIKRKQRASIQLLPLRFKDPHAEEEFVFNSSRLMIWRNICLFVFKILATTCVYGIVAASGAFGEWSYVPSSFISGLNVVYVTLLILAVLSLVVPMIPWLRARLEYSLYFLLICEALVLASFVTHEKVYSYTNSNDRFSANIWESRNEIALTGKEVCTSNPRLSVFVLSMELILDAWVQFFMYFFIITVSIVLPTRVRIAAWVQLAVLVIYCVPVFAGQAYCKILLYPELLRMLHAFFMLGAAVFGAYASESKRRGLFYSWLSMKRQMKLLEAERDKASDDNMRSGISALQNHCKQVEVALMCAKTAPGGADISSYIKDAATHAEASLDIMANSKDLYHTELQEELREKTFIKAFNVEKTTSKGLLSAGARSVSRVNPARTEPSVVGQGLKAVSVSSDGIRLPCFSADLASRVGVDISFNPMAFQRQIQVHDAENSAFFECGYTLLSRYSADWGCDDRTLSYFLMDIEGLYNKLPYHNSIHGAMAILYNDRSVLENFHSALTFKVLSQSASNIFRYLAKNELMEIRSNIIPLILATDMKTHFSALSRFRARRQNPAFDHRKQRDDTWLVVEMCMRAADIGHSVVDWDQHFEWSGRVTAEFYLQGDEETRLGRGVSPLCDRDLHSSMARNQVGFLSHIVKPLFAELNSVESMKGAFQGAVDTIEANTNKWQHLQDSGIDVKFSPAVVDVEEALMGKAHVLDITLLTANDCKCPCCRAGNVACQFLSMKVRINENVE
ncbi:uncharacterized protein LOC34622994 [Cyclospora cayetanensis]|uniref:Uncharacterized protein LOC34622994 n=1 Tax=Cyclospora cayetanensis TaxID=88456 RepID=A0A6P6RS30_9EIME|nr:uncharacterized protein LOC34622994 [Cyclospora cayetanensis]